MTDVAAIEDDLRRRLAATPIYELLRVELERCDLDEVCVRITVAKEHANLDGWLHGGVMALMADAAMGFAARLCVPAGARNRTLNVGLSFQSGGRVGEDVRCTARVSRRSGRFIWTTCAFRRVEDDELMAEGSALHYPSLPR